MKIRPLGAELFHMEG